ISSTIVGFLKYQLLLAESTKTIQEFLWSEGSKIEPFKNLTTRMIHTPTKEKYRVLEENIKPEQLKKYEL
ncbi:1883_t:CDS:2, partial [Gigaspora rosea]